MTLHVPSIHPAGLAGHHILRNALAAVVVAIVVVGFATAALFYKPVALPTALPMTEAQQLVHFRAAERADWAAGIISPEQWSLVQFRAGERQSWQSGHVPQHAGPR